MTYTIEIEEEQRQVILLALAKLSLQRPGWLVMIEEIALKMDNELDGRPMVLTELRKLYSTAAVGL